jgi:phosphoglycerate dehydrogenase-like enzyme
MPPYLVHGTNGRATEALPLPQRRLRAAIVVRELHAELVYPEEERKRAASLVDLINPTGPLDPACWPEVEVVLGGWGMPTLDAAFLQKAESLKAVFYAAGSVRCFMTEAAWARGLVVSTSVAANAATTAEFCLSEILFSLKHGWRFIRDPRESWRTAYEHQQIPGLYGSRVGLVSFGRIARRVAHLLQAFPLKVSAWDPVQPATLLSEYGVASQDLDTIFSTCDVISLHAPLLAETAGLISARLLAKLKLGATLINTSRGEIVDERALIELLRARPDVTAVLDVTSPEPPRKDSPLFTLPNVVMTPHLAGCYGPECRRLGAMAVDELARFAEGVPLVHAIGRAEAALMA